jgi:hypothetical protein
MRSNNNNKLKAFVRFDGSGRIVPSSLIVQAFKPKVGNYKEIDAKECCNHSPTVLTYTIELPQQFPIDNVSVAMNCNGEVTYGYTSETAANISELITILNTNDNTNIFGTYRALDATTVQLTVPYSVQYTICPTGIEFSFNIFRD